jgi:UrcA family protein
MFTPMLLSLAIAASPAPQHIIVVDDRPTVTIALADYDLASARDVRKLRGKIRSAADRVCIHGSGLAMYLESVPCLKSAVADADAQLDTVVANRGSSATMGATIAVSAPSN